MFERPFRRIPVNDYLYFTQLICYIHTNPQKHGFVKDFQDYPYSSYHSHLSNKETKLMRKEVIDWFGGVEAYKKIHQLVFKEAKFEKVIVDF